MKIPLILFIQDRRAYRSTRLKSGVLVGVFETDNPVFLIATTITIITGSHRSYSSYSGYRGYSSYGKLGEVNSFTAQDATDSLIHLPTETKRVGELV